MKRTFITGLLVWIPLGITLWLLSFIVSLADQTLLILPEALQPVSFLHVDIPGFGILLALSVIFITGLLTANFVGRGFVIYWEKLLARIPVVNSIYSSVKQVSDTLLSSSGHAFRKALLIEYPRKGCFTIAFLTGAPGASVAAHLPSEHVSVYVPTTPNPTSGFFLMLPKAEVIELAIGVDEALKYIISMGVVLPEDKIASFKKGKNSKKLPS